MSSADETLERLKTDLLEMLADWETQVVVDEDGWSYRDGHNRFNQGAAFATRDCIKDVREVLAKTHGE